ncbi:MAG: hypothetical protein GY892_18715, partial [Shimia sp.]|nr:hypothetical protein [Shimia sp.]
MMRDEKIGAVPIFPASSSGPAISEKSVTAKIKLLYSRGGEFSSIDVRFSNLEGNAIEVPENAVRGKSEEISAFKFFDIENPLWWMDPIEGHFRWKNERRKKVDGARITTVTGFRFKIRHLPGNTEYFGVRIGLGMGVDGHKSILPVWSDKKIEDRPFNVDVWILDPNEGRVIEVNNFVEMAWNTQLYDLGSGNEPYYSNAIQQLRMLMSAEIQRKSMDPTTAVYQVLKLALVKGPTRMDPLFEGLVAVFRGLKDVALEEMFGQFFEDHAHPGKRHQEARNLAVKLLKALGTPDAQSVLRGFLSARRSIELSFGDQERAYIARVIHVIDQEQQRRLSKTSMQWTLPKMKLMAPKRKQKHRA